MDFPLYVTFGFSLSVFNILSLLCVFIVLITIYHGELPPQLPLGATLLIKKLQEDARIPPELG